MKKIPALVCLASTIIAGPLTAAPEAFEIGPDNTNQLPRGKEADGIIGDFVLRNDKIEAVISHNAHLRRANMSTFYGDNGVTPGCLYDLTLRGSNNDQITVFTPSGQQGKVAYVKIAKSGARIYEVGISYAGRSYAEGKKIGWKDGVSAMRCLVKYSWQERSVRHRG